MLRAASEGIYGEEAWDDEEAFTAANFDHELASAPALLTWRGEHQALLDAWLSGLHAGMR